MSDYPKLVLQKEKEGKVVFMTIDGAMEMEINEFISQPTDGLLYDLNRDKATCLSQMNGDRPEYWVNNFAVAMTIAALKEQIALFRADAERLALYAVEYRRKLLEEGFEGSSVREDIDQHNSLLKQLDNK